MKKLLTGGLAALTLGGAVIGAASTASARDWDHHDHDGGGAAVAAGLAGLAVGAAIASSGPHYYYGPAPGYYAGPSYYSYYRGCRVYWRWSPYWGRYVRARACY